MKSVLKPLAHLSLLLILALSATGCLRAISHVDFPPLVSGEVDIMRGEHRGAEKILSPEELASLSGWLKSHRTGWRDILESPPPPKAIIVLRLADGQQTSLETFENCPMCQGWDTTLLISQHDGRDFAIQMFSATDFKLIQSLIQN